MHPISIIYPSTGGHLGCFYLAIVNRAERNMNVKVSLWYDVESSAYMSMSGIAGPDGNSRNLLKISIMPVLVCCPTSNEKGFLSHSLSNIYCQV